MTHACIPFEHPRRRCPPNHHTHTHTEFGLKIGTLSKGDGVLLYISPSVGTGSLQACCENWTPVGTYACLWEDVIVFEYFVNTHILDCSMSMMNMPDPPYHWICLHVPTYMCACSGTSCEKLYGPSYAHVCGFITLLASL